MLDCNYQIPINESYQQQSPKIHYKHPLTPAIHTPSDTTISVMSMTLKNVDVQINDKSKSLP